jgi:hypothetical protein
LNCWKYDKTIPIGYGAHNPAAERLLDRAACFIETASLLAKVIGLFGCQRSLFHKSG